MKKLFLGSLFFLLFSFFADSLMAADLTEKQLWAIALTGIMSEKNGSNLNTLNSSEMNTINKNIWLEILRRDWEINNRNELLKTLDEMENDGHASRLKLVKQIISEGIISVTKGEGENILVTTKNTTYKLSAIQYNRLRFTYSNWDKFKDRTILAWDLGRNIALCGWGYDVGFLTEEEALEKIMYYARLIQPLYNSWEEYGYDYYMGRVFWASGFGEATRYYIETKPIYEKLINKNGLWYNRKWNIDLK
jgi:hypothetical protein